MPLQAPPPLRIISERLLPHAQAAQRQRRTVAAIAAAAQAPLGGAQESIPAPEPPRQPPDLSAATSKVTMAVRKVKALTDPFAQPVDSNLRPSIWKAAGAACTATRPTGGTAASQGQAAGGAGTRERSERARCVGRDVAREGRGGRLLS